MKETLLTYALYFGAISHFGILIASALAPAALDWRSNLATLPPLLRQMFWVYGAFIVLTIVSFGTITLLFAPVLAQGEAIGRAFCAMIALFWLARLGVQFFVFDPEPFLTRWFYRLGYHLLTVVFMVLVVIYGWGVIA